MFWSTSLKEAHVALFLPSATGKVLSGAINDRYGALTTLKSQTPVEVLNIAFGGARSILGENFENEQFSNSLPVPVIETSQIGPENEAVWIEAQLATQEPNASIFLEIYGYPDPKKTP